MQLEYIITDGKIYFKIDKNQQQTTTYHINEAKVFPDYQKAENTIMAMKKSLQKFNWYAQEKTDVVEYTKLKEDNQNDNGQISTYIHNETRFDNMDYDWIEQIKQFSELSNEILQYKNNLLEIQKENEKEIVDIEHYIEFYNLNMYEGWKVYKMLQERRIKRRKIKDELFKIAFIATNKLNNLSCNHLMKTIEGLDSRKYEPRTKVVAELFELKLNKAN